VVAWHTSAKKALTSPHLRDRARIAFLAFVTWEIFVIPPLAERGLISPVVLAVSPSLTLVAGVLAVSERRFDFLFAGGVAVAALTVRLATLFSREPHLLLLDAIVTMVVLTTLFALLLRYVFAPARTSAHRMVGAVVAYLIIAIIFARAYQILISFNPEALDLPDRANDLTDYVYFSFATLTTLGYGLPRGPIARSLVSIEAIVGQLYLAILIARLVSAPAAQEQPSRATHST
jgi:hypothetical protein